MLAPVLHASSVDLLGCLSWGQSWLELADPSPAGEPLVFPGLLSWEVECVDWKWDFPLDWTVSRLD